MQGQILNQSVSESNIAEYGVSQRSKLLVVLSAPRHSTKMKKYRLCGAPGFVFTKSPPEETEKDNYIMKPP